MDLINPAKDTIYNIVSQKDIPDVKKICHDKSNREIHLFSKYFIEGGFTDSITINNHHNVFDDSTFEEIKANHLVWEKYTFDSLTFILSKGS